MTDAPTDIFMLFKWTDAINVTAWSAAVLSVPKHTVISQNLVLCAFKFVFVKWSLVFYLKEFSDILV
jgi:hypothetical protein